LERRLEFAHQRAHRRHACRVNRCQCVTNQCVDLVGAELFGQEALNNGNFGIFFIG